MVKYTRNQKGEILKDGHTMFPGDILSDLKRKAFLEDNLDKQLAIGKRRMLLMATYCGDDNCTDGLPCEDCLKMSNVIETQYPAPIKVLGGWDYLTENNQE